MIPSATGLGPSPVMTTVAAVGILARLSHFHLKSQFVS